MKKKLFVLTLVVFAMAPMAYAETAQECSANCVNKCQSLGSGPKYATCLENCLKGCYDKPSGIPPVPPPKPTRLSEFTAIASNFPEDCSEKPTEIFVAALGDKMGCVDKGKVIGKCHELTPYDNVLNGECYATQEECKKSAGGYDFCSKCTTPCK